MQQFFTGSSLGPTDALLSMSGPYISAGWLHPGSTPSGYMGSTGTVCSLHQTHPFTRCSITSSYCDLTVSLHSTPSQYSDWAHLEMSPYTAITIYTINNT